MEHASVQGGKYIFKGENLVLELLVHPAPVGVDSVCILKAEIVKSKKKSWKRHLLFFLHNARKSPLASNLFYFELFRLKCLK